MDVVATANGVNGMDVSEAGPSQAPLTPPVLSNGFHKEMDEPILEVLEAELPMVYDGQAPLGELLQRVSQAIYAELTELAETLPGMSDANRKRTLVEWVVKTKKQVVKLYAVAKWARDADVVQKCMNITAFLMTQSSQFDESIDILTRIREGLDSARARNHDLLTSLDVPTTGSYQRLPSEIKKFFIPVAPLTDEEVAKTLKDMDGVIRYRLRMAELIPVEMLQYRIGGGRVFFTVPNLFEVSLSLSGVPPSMGWFFVHTTFLFTIGGDRTGLQDFPREPVGIVKQFITKEADARLAFYLPPPADEPPPPPDVEIPPRPSLPPGTIDAPLIRLFNFLQMMSLSYQLEILWYQAERMRSLGWAEYLTVEMARDRKSFTASYWVRQPPRNAQPQGPQRNRLPLLGGTLTIAIVPAKDPPARRRDPATGPATRIPKDRVRAELEERAKLAFAGRAASQARTTSGADPTSAVAHALLGATPNNASGASSAALASPVADGAEGAEPAVVPPRKASDEVEGLKFEVRWEPVRNALGVPISEADVVLPKDALVVRADDLDFGGLLQKVIASHTRAILSKFEAQLLWGPMRAAFSRPGDVSLVEENGALALRVHLCADEVVVVALDARTGRLAMRDTGDLASAGRGPRFAAVTNHVNENPPMLVGALARMRVNTIVDLAEQKANYLGLRNFRQRHFTREEMVNKLGSTARGTLFIQLAPFPSHYLVLVITDDAFRYALISVMPAPEARGGQLMMGEIVWLDVRRIHGGGIDVGTKSALEDGGNGTGIGRENPIDLTEQSSSAAESRYILETQVLRELYAYCCARVSYMKVEKQLKFRGIPYTHVNRSTGTSPSPPDLGHPQSTLAQSLPTLCVRSSDILSGSPAAEAAMPNIQVMPFNWWSERKAQVVTCVKLKYVQQPVGKRAGTSSVIRLSKRIIYDSAQAVVSFLSEDIDNCVDEFLAEWAKVSKMVLIAREVAEMGVKHKWNDVRLLSFDLQTVEFTYADDYTVSMTCADPLSPSGGSYELRFGRSGERDERTNPHEDMIPLLCAVLRRGPLGRALTRLVGLLRDTLPVAAELEDIQARAVRDGVLLDAHAKDAGWHRILYGDLKHALDFRLLSDHRVAVIDASHPLFSVRGPPTAVDGVVGLLPLPGLQELAAEVVREAALPADKVALMGAGILCHTSVVRTVGRALHDRLLARLRKG